MANPHKGEVSFVVGGKARTVRLSTNAICVLEDELGLSVDGISTRMVQGYLSVLRSVLRVALNDGTTAEQAGDMIDELGPRAVCETLIQTFRLAFPDTSDDADPPTGAAGTGLNS
jgi:hypothetical protein